MLPSREKALRGSTPSTTSEMDIGKGFHSIMRHALPLVKGVAKRRLTALYVWKNAFVQDRMCNISLVEETGRMRQTKREERAGK